MPSGLNIDAGIYIEEPLRTRVGLPVIPDSAFVFGTKNRWQKQTRPPAAYVEYETARRRGTDDAKFRCNWCGSTQVIQPNPETISQRCPNCGGPR